MEFCTMSRNTFFVVRAQAPVIQTLDSAIHRTPIGFPNTYPLDSDLSGG